MQRQRFVPTLILRAFDSIVAEQMARGTTPREVERRKRRAFYALGGYSYPSNGLRETARRRAQIAAGSLRVENGLDPAS